MLMEIFFLYYYTGQNISLVNLSMCMTLLCTK